jgi:hypothetical protein
MQKWEYCSLKDTGDGNVLTIYRADKAQHYPIKRDKVQGDISHQDAFDRLIATLGSDGWELIGFTSFAGHTSNWVFKRPITS